MVIFAAMSLRMRIATVGQAKSVDIATYMQEIADDLAAELERR